MRAINDPASGKDIVTAGLVEGIELRGGLVQVALLTDRAHAAAMEPVRRSVETLLSRQPGITNATAVLTAHKAPPRRSPRARAAGRATVMAMGRSRRCCCREVKAIVAVASGKGGVGKSTVAVNLAVSLARPGHKTGLLDADIYGPSLPRMLGLSRKPEVRGEKMIPLQAWGLSCMSIGFLVDEETPMIWRGPMVMGALEQMMGQVEWGALDILVVDMPPGTGDAQLTMAQRVALTGAVIVSTPQDIALIDARRGVRMFERMRVPVLGLVENMSFFCCPNCGHRTAHLRPRRRAAGGAAAGHRVPGRGAAAAGYPHGVGCRHADRRGGAGQRRRRRRSPRWPSGCGRRCRASERCETADRASSSSDGRFVAPSAGPPAPVDQLSNLRDSLSLRSLGGFLLTSPPSIAASGGAAAGSGSAVCTSIG